MGKETHYRQSKFFLVKSSLGIPLLCLILPDVSTHSLLHQTLPRQDVGLCAEAVRMGEEVRRTDLGMAWRKEEVLLVEYTKHWRFVP